MFLANKTGELQKLKNKIKTNLFDFSHLSFPHLYFQMPPAPRLSLCLECCFLQFCDGFISETSKNQNLIILDFLLGSLLHFPRI
jgi:hypothetical protein